MKAWELLSDRSKWTDEYFASDIYGRPRSPRDSEACSFCAHGAVIHCYGSDEPALVDALKKAWQVAQQRHGKGLVQVNHQLGYDAVMSVLKEADV